jgi:hypothetical protein
MNLQNALKLKLAHSSFQDIAQLMGYSRKSKLKAAKRIDNVLSDPQLNLYVGAFDFRYSNEQFLNKLCEVVGIEIRDFQDEINIIQSAYNKMRGRFKSYVFIDTGFKRANQPIFALAFSESMRHIQLGCDVQLLPIHEQVVRIQSLVKNHYADCNGTLELWGNIQRYVFIYAEGCSLALSGDGVILADNPIVNVPHATVGVNNTDVTSLLVGK